MSTAKQKAIYVFSVMLPIATILFYQIKLASLKQKIQQAEKFKINRDTSICNDLIKKYESSVQNSQEEVNRWRQNYFAEKEVLRQTGKILNKKNKEVDSLKKVTIDLKQELRVYQEKLVSSKNKKSGKEKRNRKR